MVKINPNENKIFIGVFCLYQKSSYICGMNTETIDIRQKVRENLKTSTEIAQKKADIFKKNTESLEKDWVKYYNELKKQSDNFKFIVSELEPQTFPIWVHSYNPDGTINGGAGLIRVGEIKVPHKNFIIEYDVKMPNDCTKARVKVEDHITSRRRSWSSTNHGAKMKAVLGWNEDGNYYKTAKKIFEIVNNYVEQKWNDHNRTVNGKILKNDAIDFLIKKYPNSKIEHSDRGLKQITITHKNNTSVTVSYSRDENSQVKFNVIDIKVSQVSDVHNFIDKIGSL